MAFPPLPLTVHRLWILERVVDTDSKDKSTPLTSSSALPRSGASLDALYQSPNEALKALREEYQYWTGRLTDTSLQLSYAVIAANWAVFGSVDKILNNRWSQISIGLVVAALLLSVFGAKWMGELHRKQIDRAESNLEIWNSEFKQNAGKRVPWPFTSQIESLGRISREVRVWLPLLAGIAFLIALVSASPSRHP